MQDGVLVIDVDANERHRIAAVLASDGFDVAQRLTPIEGLMGVIDTRPALIVLAEETEPLRLRDVLALTTRLTSAPVMVIGDGGVNREADALQGGAATYVSRPFSVGELAGRARMLVRERKDGVDAQYRPEPGKRYPETPWSTGSREHPDEER